MLRVQRLAWCLALCTASTALLACCEGDEIRWDLYHKSDAILDFFKKTALKLPTRVRYENLPDPDTDTSLPVVTITDFATGEAGKEVILLVGGEHARELITSEIVFWLGNLLAGIDDELMDWAAIQSATASAWKRGWAKGTFREWADDLLKHVLFKIIPIENIQGRKAVEGGDNCLRKTTAGVDLNRNWEFAWTAAEEGSEEYGGPRPFSEPETRIVRLIGQATRPQAFVNLHSGEYAVYVPWDSRRGLAPDLPADVGEVLEKLDSYCQCMHGAAGEVAGYLAFGSSMDYMYKELNVAYPLTIEVYGPDGLGKTAMGGHPRRRLSQASVLETGPPPAINGTGAHAKSGSLPIATAAGGGALALDTPAASGGPLSKAGVLDEGLDEGFDEDGGMEDDEDARRTQLQEAGALRAQQQAAAAFRVDPGLQEARNLAATSAGGEAAAGGGGGGAGGAAGGSSPAVEGRRCLADYNPLEREEYEEVVATWLASLLVLASHLAAHPAASSAAADAEQGQLPQPPTPPSKQDLAATGRLAEDHMPSDFSQMVAGSPVKKKEKGSLPWLPANMALPESFQHQVLEQAMPRNTTQMVLLGGIVGSLVLALYCLWAKTGRPLPWTPGRRRSLSRHRAGRHNV